MNSPMISPEDVMVRVQSTPNPYALKFVVNQSLKNNGKATVSDPVEVEGLPLVADLFHIPGVKQLYFFQNTLTVTHGGELIEDELEDQVVSVLKTRLPVHNPDFSLKNEVEDQKNKKHDYSDKPEVIQKIEAILDRTVRPGLQADGGDIEIIRLEGNELQILYQGACGGCPSAMFGTLDAIQGILQNELDWPELTVAPV